MSNVRNEALLRAQPFAFKQFHVAFKTVRLTTDSDSSTYRGYRRFLSTPYCVSTFCVTSLAGAFAVYPTGMFDNVNQSRKKELRCTMAMRFSLVRKETVGKRYRAVPAYQTEGSPKLVRGACTPPIF